MTMCNIEADGTIWERPNAKRSAEQAAGEPRYRERGGVRAVAIEREFELPSSQMGTAS